MPDLPVRYPPQNPLPRWLRWVLALAVVALVVWAVFGMDNPYLPFFIVAQVAFQWWLGRGSPHTRIEADHVVVRRSRNDDLVVQRSDIAAVDRKSSYSPVHLTLHDGEVIVLPGTHPEQLDEVRRLVLSG